MEEQIKSKVSQRKETIYIRAQINELRLEIGKQFRKINKAKGCFLLKICRIDKPYQANQRKRREE